MNNMTSCCACARKPRTCAAAPRKTCPRPASSASSRSPSLVPVKDSLEAALAQPEQTVDTLREGVEVTLKQLAAAFERNLLKEIAPAQGDKFDPHLHQAISSVPADQPANTVLQLLQKGYAIADRTLRPALVVVSAGQG